MSCWNLTYFKFLQDLLSPHHGKLLLSLLTFQFSHSDFISCHTYFPANLQMLHFSFHLGHFHSRHALLLIIRSFHNNRNSLYLHSLKQSLVDTSGDGRVDPQQKTTRKFVLNIIDARCRDHHIRQTALLCSSLGYHFLASFRHLLRSPHITEGFLNHSICSAIPTAYFAFFLFPQDN